MKPFTTLACVDPNRIGGLGICAGSGCTIKAAALDGRVVPDTVDSTTHLDMREAHRRK